MHSTKFNMVLKFITQSTAFTFTQFIVYLLTYISQFGKQHSVTLIYININKFEAISGLGIMFEGDMNL